MTNANDFELLHESDGTPSISFLMPIFQQEAYVREALLSVLRQQKVIVEVLVSDDCSSDQTYTIARETILQWVAQESGGHRVWLRRGRDRLRRNHLPLLIDHASCDLVCQAHGDDLSHPLRAAKQVEIFATNPEITLAAFGAAYMKNEDRPACSFGDMPESGPYPAYCYSVEQLISGHETMIGFCQVWRKSSVGQFDRLDGKLAAVGHDRILPFRAALVGKVVFVRLALLLRRVHNMSWSNLMFAEPRGEYPSFGWSLCRVSAMNNMLADLCIALKLGLVAEERFGVLRRTIEELQGATLENMLMAFRVHTAGGRQIAWVDEKTLIHLRNTGKA